MEGMNPNGIGIIPARAGFTAGPPSADQEVPGSSPLARGLRPTQKIQRGHRRIIPARAGFTSSARSRRPSWPDHPRSRGVYAARRAVDDLERGSSPLARGLRRASPASSRSRGIIPARAGFTLADPWNPNEPTLYQTPAAFTAVLGAAPPGRDSAVEFGAALSTAGRAGRNLAAAGLRPRFGHHPDRHRRVATTSG